MKRNSKPILIAFILTAILFFSIGFLVGKGKNTVTTDPSPSVAPVETPATVVENPVEIVEEKIKEDGVYSSKEDVALYIHTYGKLPKNYVTKKEAANLGYKASKHNLWDVCESCVIGGNTYGNREKQLPEKEGRKYWECDIDYDGYERNAERIVYSNDGLIYYTDDHYKTFTLLYGDPDE